MDRTTTYEDVLNRRLRVMRMLWFAFSGSVLIYLAVGYLVTMAGRPAPPNIAVLRLALDAVGVITALGVIVFKMVAFTREQVSKRLAEPARLEQIAGTPNTGEPDAAVVERLRSLSEKEQKLLGFIAWYQIRFILVLALNESIALLGLVLTILTGSPSEMLPFLGVALFLNARMFFHPQQMVEDAELAAERM